MLADIYPQLLAFHGLLRWFVLAAALAALAVAFAGWSGNKPTGKLRLFTVIFVIGMDLEFLVGLILFVWLSPVTHAAFADFADAMKNKEPRFFTVEHTTMMFLALICAHVGAALSRKARTDRLKFRGAAVAYGISLVLMLAGIPWWRPLLRY
jgi:hypothetical protein